MEMLIRAMRPEEQKYTYAQSTQISAQTGLVGHLRADLDSTGEGFFSSWENQSAPLNTVDFKACLEEVINALRFEDRGYGILKNRASLAAFCNRHPESGFGDERQHGLRVDTPSYAMLMRLNPYPGEYNLYCYCYVRDWLDRHLHQAARGIRFISPDYTELFRIPDGDRIRIFTGGGEIRDRTCRYLDDYHMETSDGFSTTIYHIAEFAERSELTGAKVVPLRRSLPEKCFSVLEMSNELIEITKGTSGYSCSEKELGSYTPREAADRLNRELGVTPAQEQAMVAGSMFGWAVPAADPANYAPDGKAIHPSQRGRDDAR